ncbi:MAG: PP2C family protein-serine/threonine phosphatase, partial [bacterium]
MNASTTLQITSAAITHDGLKRDHNEDTFAQEPDLSTWLVADGMGGHQHGEVASAMARDYIIAGIREGKSLEDAVKNAGKLIADEAHGGDEPLPMGTTVVACKVQADRAYFAWVGDSRIYSLSPENELTQISNDHSYVQELVDQGAISLEQARVHPHRNVVTQALGVSNAEDLFVEISEQDLTSGMRILMCSDGLTEEVPDSEILHILSKRLSGQESIDQLLVGALENGGSDNITIILID